MAAVGICVVCRESCYYATRMHEQPELDAALRERFVQVVEHLDDAVASYERLGFEQVLGWAGEGVLFRTGPALLEVVEASGLEAGASAA
jgi:hypothetical protein